MAGSIPASESSTSSDSEGPRAAPVAAQRDGTGAPGPAGEGRGVAVGKDAHGVAAEEGLRADGAERNQSSDGDDSDARRRRRRREKQHSKDKGLKVKKSSSKERKHKRKRRKEEKERKAKKDKGPVQLSKFLQRGEGSSGAKYSVVSGKKIKLKVEKTKADREAEKNRSALLAVLNASYD